MTEFEGVFPALGRALTKRGYTVLTSVQKAVLEPELTAADLLVSAQTGSGKTVAFGMSLAPTLLEGAERFPRASKPVALAVAPTRELALQVKSELDWLFEMTGANVASCVGGMDMRTERRELSRGAHIVVGTPGRLRDHIERGSLDMSGLKAVVLDEADEMLDLGFRDDLEFILGAAPSERRTLLFSATVPRSIVSLAKKYQRDAVRVSTTEEQKQHLDIEYKAFTVAAKERENAIINVLRFFEAKSAIVFCATRATVNHMTSRFTNRGFSVVALSGELSQSQRTHALQAMRDGRARVCIATDVAARGIDLPNLELVIHADIPKNRESLLHRSGRTGRAGRKGVSAVIVPHSARKRTERLFQNAKVEANWANPPSVADIMRRDDERILADPALNDPAGEEEQAFAREILASHGAEQVAAAFVRLYRAGQSAPEELLDKAPAPSERKAKQRDDFKNGVWFSLSVGRKHTAEARWLLPMLCRAGKLNKGEIGAIKIQENETYVELEPNCVDRFLAAVGPSRKVEKTVTVTRLNAMPEGLSERPQRSRGNQYEKKKYKSEGQGRPRPKPANVEKPDLNPVEEFLAKPEDERRDDSKRKFSPKKKTKKSKKAKEKKLKKQLAAKSQRRGFDKGDGGSADRSGSAPLRRKQAKAD